MVTGGEVARRTAVDVPSRSPNAEPPVLDRLDSSNYSSIASMLKSGNIAYGQELAALRPGHLHGVLRLVFAQADFYGATACQTMGSDLYPPGGELLAPIISMARRNPAQVALEGRHTTTHSVVSSSQPARLTRDRTAISATDRRFPAGDPWQTACECNRPRRASRRKLCAGSLRSP